MFERSTDRGANGGKRTIVEIRTTDRRTTPASYTPTTSR
jgi:hypothetical protein